MEKINMPVIPVSIKRENIDAMMRSIKEGDVITETIKVDKLGERLMRPVRVKCRVIAKYPYLVELDTGAGKLPRKTATYVDILLMMRKGEKDNV